MRSARTAQLRAGVLIAIGLAVAAGVSWWLLRAPPPRDNVIVIVLDTTRCDALGCYGSQRGATPHIDKLATESVRFDQVIGTSCWTLPSFASLFSSTYPTIHGGFGRGAQLELTRVRDAVVLGPEVFQRAGFKTHAIVNAAFLNPSLGLNRGFDGYDLERSYNYECRRADKTVDAALAHLMENRGERNFLLVHFFDPHLRYDPPPGWAEKFIGAYDGPYRKLEGKKLDAMTWSMMLAKFRPAAEDGEYLRNMNLAEIAAVDDQLGRFFAELKKLGMYETATIVITTDHGEEFWDHGGFEHGHSMYDELIRLPLIIKPGRPDIQPGVVHSLVRQIDIMPTLLELSGIAERPATFEGSSLVALLGGGTEEVPREAFAEGTLYGSAKAAYRSGDYKYVLDFETGDGALYNLGNDSGERTDLTPGDARHAAVMRDKLTTFHKRLVDRSAKLPKPELVSLQEDLFKCLESLGYVRGTPP